MKVSGNIMEKEVKILCEKIIKFLPKFFDDFEGWQYGTGTNAGKDFKNIFNSAKKINKKIKSKQ